MAQAVRVGDLVFVSGQVALDAEGSLVGAGDAEAQAEQCFANLERVLSHAGCGLRDVVKLTCYLASLDAFDGYSKVKARIFDGIPPASTAVRAELLDDRFLMEVEAVAVVEKD
ncbi:MAG TPA: RidA family protein [Acidimicrobiales bacterium]